MCNEAEIEWIDCILDDVATVSSGESPPSTIGNIPVFGANGIIGFTDISNHEDSILLGRVGSAGEVNFAEGPCWVSDNALIVTPNTDIITNQYLFHLLRSIDFKSQITKTAQPLMTQTRLKETPLRIPNSISIQNTITDILDYSDDCLVSTRQLLRKLEMIREGMLEDLLTLGLREDGCLRDHGIDEFIETDIGRIPASWSLHNVDEICSRITDGEHITPPRTKYGVLLLSARNVQDSYLSLNNVDYVSNETYERLCERIRPSFGDVLVSCSGSIGRTCLVTEELEFHLVRSVAILRPNEEISGGFLEMAFQGKSVQSQISNLVNKTAQGNLFQGKIKQILIPMPPPDEANLIVQSFASIRTRIVLAKRELSKHQMMKTGLQNDLLTGALPIPVELLSTTEAVA